MKKELKLKGYDILTRYMVFLFEKKSSWDTDEMMLSIRDLMPEKNIESQELWRVESTSKGIKITYRKKERVEE